MAASKSEARADASTPEGSVTSPEARAYQAAQEAEWGTYVATQPIYHGGVRAYNEGDPVPATNVKAYDYEAQGLVKKR